jgi:membrane protease YdiL (CAAX protease family)
MNGRRVGLVAAVLGIVFLFTAIAKWTGIVMFGAIGVAVAAVAAWYVGGRGTAGLLGLGLGRPRSWAMTLISALVTAVLGQLAVSLLTPLAVGLWGAPDFSALGAIQGHPWVLAKYLVIIWTTAAFGEEIVFRGFLIPRIAQVYGDTWPAKLGAIVTAAIFFGAAHAYQGLSGAVLTGVIALVYGAAFVAARGNLWRTILAHGLYDSTAFILLYLAK